MVEDWEDERFIEHLEEESLKELLRERSIRIERSNMTKVQKDAARLMTMTFPGFAIHEEIHDR